MTKEIEHQKGIGNYSVTSIRRLVQNDWGGLIRCGRYFHGDKTKTP